MRGVRRGDNQRIAIRQVVRDFLTALVRVIALDTCLGKIPDDLRKVKLSGQRSTSTLLNNFRLFRIHDFSFFMVVKVFLN